MFDAVRVLTPLRHALSQAVADATTKDGANAAIAAVCDAWADSAQLAETIYRPALHADMGGQLMVREVEAGVGPKRRKLADVGQPFLEMVWDEAISAFAQRKVMTPSQFYRLSDDARERGFTATRLMTQTLRERAKDELARVLSEGGTFEDFARAMQAEQITLGVGGADVGYLDTVFRTNVLGAYGAGRYKQVLNKDVIAARPLVQYRTAGDGRVRAAHRALDGQVFRTADRAWRSVAPPNGFACRCTIVTLADYGGEISSQPAHEADEGFRAPPTMELDE